MQVQVIGANRFKVVARQLRTAANRNDLLTEMRKGITKATPVLRDAVKERADEFLPNRYAAELVGSMRVTTVTRTTGDQVTVTMTVTAKGHGGNARKVGEVEKGRLRHPVYGRDRKLRRHWVHKATSSVNPWVEQHVKPGFVAKPMADKAPDVRKEIEAAVDRVLEKITEG